ncbi:MAG: C25 family cysteine peptidase [Lentimicrobiaceae bacterium]|nr:C25 family cysteine peptidase [Lentimicrobiaceae bacterium]
MKKFILLFLFFAFHAILVSTLFAQEITYNHLRDKNGISIHMGLQSYEISSLNYRGEDMHEINLSGIFIPNDEGMPNLPRMSKFIAVPKGAELRVSINSMETETFQNINLAPALRIQAIPEDPVIDYVKDERVYTTNEYYPQNPVEISEVTTLRGVNTVVLGITPFQYNPVTKELIVINNIDLNIEYIGGTREYDDPKYRSPWFDPILKNAILNYEVLPEMEYTAKNSKSGTGCEYLIVIPNREDFLPYAEQIKEFRTKQGIYTQIMKLEEMEVTNTTQLKAWFHNAYNTWDNPPVAVLLMADHNTNVALGIPAETISHPYSGSCITDNQYADVTGNLLPDMVFGRMAAETEAQMAILVSKFMEYETQPCMDPAYYQNPITALGWQTVRWFQICSEVVGGYWRNQNKTPVRINAIYEGSPGSTWSSASNTSSVINYFGPNGTGYIPATPSELGGWSGGTPAQVVTAINNGAFALQHRDHGFENGWGEPAFQSNHISQLNNVGKMTYVFTINCLTGKFNHSSPCFGEVFHRYTYQGQNAGCVGFLGPTEVSYSFVNDVYAWGMYDLFDPEFMPTYGPNYGTNAGPHVGYSGNWMPAFGNVSGKYFLYSSSWPYNTGDKNITYQMFTSHSDLFLRLFTEVPQQLTVNHQEVSLAGMSTFQISANEGALIALTAEIDGNLEILDIATATGTIQDMMIPSTLLPTTEINVVITGQNFLRYEAVVAVVPAEGPYIIPIDYTVVEEDILTYISENSEISVTFKNVGIESTEPLNITIASNDPQLSIDKPNAQCGSITPDGTATVNFNVTVANDIQDGKTFPIEVTVIENGKGRTWESKMSLKAYAPKFAIEKVLINGAENGSLPKGTVVTLTTVIKNKGGADAFNLKGSLEMNSPYVTLACDEDKSRAAVNLEAGESMNFDFVVITSPDMPFGHIANFDLLVDANYGISYEKDFTVSNSGSSNYCSSGSQNCSQSDKFTSVILYKTSDASNLLINNLSTACVTGGYQDYTSTNVVLEPGENYTVKVKCGYNSQQVGGWFDFNGDNEFTTDEKKITLTCGTANTEYTANFTVPENFVPGTSRFRLVCKWSGTPVACNNESYGQTHDYTITLPELYARVQNVEAELSETTITTSWEAPAEGTPTGYNIYRDGNKLNSDIITDLTYTEEDVTEGVYVYNVTAIYEGNKESFAEMSNVICFFLPPEPEFCEPPVELAGIDEEANAILTWNTPENIDGELLGYNIYRDEVKINTEILEDTEYTDENLENGTYIYKVSAIYKHCEESELTEGVSVTIDVLGIPNLPSSSFSLFPNPTTGELRVTSYGLQVARIEIFDVYGRNVMAKFPSNTLEGWQLKADGVVLNVSHLQDGIYFVKIYSETGEVAVKRLVVMKF